MGARGICELCCNEFSEDNLEEILDVTRKMLTILLFQVNMDKRIRAMICRYCSDMVKVLFEFKSACFNTNDFISPFVDELESDRVSLKEVFIRENGDKVATDTLHNWNVCRLCMEVVDIGGICLDGKDSHANLVKNLIERCIPEVDVNNTRNNTVCDACIEYMTNYSDFLDSCTGVEKKIKYDCVQNGTDANDRAMENLNLLSGDEETFSEGETGYQIKTEEIDIKSYQFESLQRSTVDNKRPEYEVQEDDNTESTLSSSSLCRLAVTKVPTKSDRRFECDFCDLKTKYKIVLKRHMLSHKDPLKVKWFQCDSCDYKTIHSRYLKNHMVNHKNPSEIKCESCDYKAKEKSRLKRHILIHKELLDVERFQCDLCDYKTVQKRYLKNHMLTHKEPSEIKWFKCDLCDYKGKLKQQLKRHMVNHMERREKKWFTCDSCDYKSIHKQNLKTHMVTHKDPSERKWFRCDLCDLKTRCRFYLKKHMLFHNESSVSEWLQCDLCDYKTVHKQYLQKHMLTHKDSSEIKWFECYSCDFKAREKRHIKQHTLIHKDPLKVDRFRCDLCDYKTIQKRYLKNHMMIHKDPSEIRWFECDLCDYKAKIATNLKRHKSIHIRNRQTDPGDGLV
ncbi:hypothetical protein NQ315_007448 [Exocentrus adspersus]|uniref:Protein hunchback n=1 Tax=Exocentrus adspersus TaxID=1586481 RepID=A0AAV8VIL4_9CUCU|nr:hypothetical protein NQ315_007448 [Exocentrus adspersus]